MRTCTTTGRDHELRIRSAVASVAVAFALAVLGMQGCEDRGAAPEGPLSVSGETFDDELCALARPYPGSLTVVAPPNPLMVGGVWSGWWSATVSSSANSNGVVYTLEARWPGVNGFDDGSSSDAGSIPATSTMLMTVGGSNGGFNREGYSFGRAFQDSLIAMGVRPIDLKFVGGSDTFPQNGWVNISAAYADAVWWLIVNGIAAADITPSGASFPVPGGDSNPVTGLPLLAFGNSGGANMVAAAWTSQNLPFDGVLLGGGPFAVRMDLCPGEAIADWCFDDLGPCQFLTKQQRLCRSLWNHDAKRLFPTEHLAIFIGQNDPRANFLVQESNTFLEMVHVGPKGQNERVERPASPHAILNTQEGMNAILNAVEEMLR